MEKNCTNCIWYQEYFHLCNNGNSTMANTMLTEYGDPKRMICGHYEEDTSVTHHDQK